MSVTTDALPQIKTWGARCQMMHPIYADHSYYKRVISHNSNKYFFNGYGVEKKL